MNTKIRKVTEMIKIKKILTIGISLMLFWTIQSYATETGTVRLGADGGTPWTNVDVTTSYNECIALNNGNSSLGTSALDAHLSTDADWSAMAIFTVSKYGGQTTNTPTSTTGNNSGIQNIGVNYHQAAGVQQNTTSYVNGLYENGQPKKYVTQWGTDKAATNFVGFTTTAGWYSSWQYWSNESNYPLSIKQGLFGFVAGNDHGDPYRYISSGRPRPDVSFRPVLWN